ncbi:MAG: hypothetical protein AAB495_04630 [Patescibacteria group bacterium]
MLEVMWDAPEFEHRPKTVSWYWITIIAAALLVGVAVWQRNVLFGIFVVIAEVLILVWAEREPRNITFHLSEKHISIDENKRHALDEFVSFSIDDGHEEEIMEAFLRFKSHFRPILRVRIPSEKLVTARQVLQSKLPESKFEPALLDVIERFLGF